MQSYSEKDIQDLIDCLRTERQTVEKLQAALSEERRKVETLSIDLKENSGYVGELQKQLLQLKTASKSGIVETAQKADIRKLQDEKLEVDTKLKITEAQLKTQKERAEELTAELGQKVKLLQELKDFELCHRQQNEKRKILEETLQVERQNFKKLQHEHKQQIDELAETKLHSIQLEKGIQYLRAKIEEGKTDRDVIAQELNEAQGRLRALQIDCEEKDKELKKIEELEALRQQYDALKVRAQQTFEKEQKTQEALLRITKEKEQLTQEVQNRNQKIIEIEGVLSGLKQSVAIELQAVQAIEQRCRALEEVQKLSEEQKLLIQKQQTEITTLKEELSEVKPLSQDAKRFQTECEEFKGKSSRLEAQLADLVKEHHTFAAVRTQFEEQIDILECQVRDKEQLLEKKNTETAQLKYEITRIKEQSAQQGQALQEKDAELKMAQQHLAKKMKDIVLQNEKAKEFENLLADYKFRLETAVTKMNEMKLILETTEKEKSAQIARLEAETMKWEGRAEEFQRKNQELSLKVNELVPLSEKYQQMQAVFGQLGSVFMAPQSMAPQSMASPIPLVKEVPPQKPQEPILHPYTTHPIKEKVVMSREEVHADLFSQISPPPKHRKTLFDE